LSLHNKCLTGIDGAQTLGVYPLLTAADMAEEDTEHLGIMAYAAKFINMKPVSISAFSKYEQKQVNDNWDVKSIDDFGKQSPGIIAPIHS
jgi:hypothetical protein